VLCVLRDIERIIFPPVSKLRRIGTSGTLLNVDVVIDLLLMNVSTTRCSRSPRPLGL
jgi:hypothetical protein